MLMLLEDGRDDRSIWRPVPGSRSQLLVELVAAPGGVDDDDLGGLIRQVEEGVWDLGRQVRKAALVE